MRCKILNAISRKHLRCSLFVKRIIVIKAQLYFLGLVGLQILSWKFSLPLNNIRQLQIQNEVEYENDFKQCMLIIKYETLQLKRSYNL